MPWPRPSRSFEKSLADDVRILTLTVQTVGVEPHEHEQAIQPLAVLQVEPTLVKRRFDVSQARLQCAHRSGMGTDLHLLNDSLVVSFQPPV